MKSSFRYTLGGLLLAFSFAVANVHGQGTAFTYQGMLDVSGIPVSGNYDLTFQLFSAATNGVSGPTVTNLDTTVTNGLFTVSLDFGGGVFPGSNNWVQISARTNGGGAFAALTPLLPITPTPYALAAGTASNALTATTATTASSLSGTIGSVNLSGTYTNAVTFSNTNNVFVGNGAGLQGVVATSVSTNFSISDSSPVQLTNSANVFVGSGAGLTNLSASQLVGGPWSNALVAGLTNLGGYYATNSSTGAASTIGTNGHLTLVDSSGTIVETKSNGLFEIIMTNGNAFLFSNGSLTILSNGGGLQYASGSLTLSSNLVVSNDTTIVGNLAVQGSVSGITLAATNITGTIPLSSENPAILTNGYTASAGVASNFSVGGNLSVTGIISGNGAGLTNVPGAGVSGLYTNAVTFSNAANVFVGDGAGLTNLPGTTVSGVYTNAVTFSNAGNVFVGDGAGLSNVSIAGGGLSGVFSNTVTFTSANNLFIGDGSGLSNVTAVTVSGNIVPLTLTNTSNVFVGDGSGLSNVTAVVSGAGAVDLTNRNNLFVGDGSGISNVTASVFSGAVSNVSLTGSYTAAVTISNASDVFAGDGSGLTSLNASSIATGTVPLTAEDPAVLTNNEAAAVTLTSNLAVGGNLAVSGVLSGNGAGLTNLALGAAYTNAIVVSNSADQFAGDGSGLTNLIGTPLYGSVNLVVPTNTTFFVPLTGSGTNYSLLTASASTNLYNAVTPRNEVVSHFTFSTSIPIPTGSEYIVALLTNGTQTPIAVTIHGDNTIQIGTDFTHVVNIPAGTQQMLAITSVVPAGGVTYFNWSLLVK